MSISELGSLGEFVASVAVVISLLMLVVQLRSNTTALRSASYQSIHDAEDRFYSDLANDPVLARLWRQSSEGLETVSDKDLPQMEMLIQRYIFLLQNVHYQRRKGMVDDEMWTAWDEGWIEFMAMNKGFQQVYEQNQAVYTPPFREYTDSCKERFKGDTTSLLSGRQSVGAK